MTTSCKFCVTLLQLFFQPNNQCSFITHSIQLSCAHYFFDCETVSKVGGVGIAAIDNGASVILSLMSVASAYSGRDGCVSNEAGSVESATICNGASMILPLKPVALVFDLLSITGYQFLCSNNSSKCLRGSDLFPFLFSPLLKSSIFN